jgi:hypothetical protein
MKVLSSAWLAIILPAFVGVGCSGLAVHGFGVYGWSLFVVLPILVSTGSSFLWSLQPARSFWRTYGVALSSILLLGVILLFMAIDGFTCLVMALPISAALAIPGTLFGRYLALLASSRRGGTGLPCFLVVLFPPIAAFEASTQSSPPIRTVTTSVAIRAPAERVWQVVVAFPSIAKAPGGIFRLGFAYPLSAQISGSGVGAIRYCTFSTGSFIEPITGWEPPRLLAFDVASCPEPMQEFSPYRDFHARHLKNYMVSHRGEFRILQDGASTVLQGTTWYTHSISPQWYWTPISDYIVHRIHERVLTHIKSVAEGT